MSPVIHRTWCSTLLDCAVRSSSAKAASHSAWLICALSMITRNSRARSRGMVGTATPPALTTPNQQAAIIGVFGLRNSTRLPGTKPMSCTSTWATRLLRSSSSA